MDQFPLNQQTIWPKPLDFEKISIELEGYC
jgi:hypothetical protein